MSDAQAPRPAVHAPRQWGVLSGIAWAVVAFFAPQFLLYPFGDALRALPADRNVKLFILQGAAELVTIVVLWFVLRRVYRVRLSAVGLGRPTTTVLWAVVAFPVYMVASLFVSNLIATVFGANLTEAQNLGYTNPNGAMLALVFVALVCLAPFAEELLFRGFLFTAFRRVFGFWGGALIVSLLFAVAHGQLNVGIDVFVLSMFLCYLRERTNSLWPAIALHGLKNLVAFILLFIIGVK